MLALPGRWLDWLVVLTAAWMVGGAWIDAWSHHATELESFFTPAHGVLYAGYLAAAAVLVGASLTRSDGRIGIRPPPGYTQAMAGVPLFLLGGVGDAVWHTVFGIEADVDALLSPTHLGLGMGAALMASGPLVAAWGRSGAASTSRDETTLGWPAVISLGLLVSTIAFFTAYASPIALPLAAGDRMPELANFGIEQSELASLQFPLLGQALGVASILLLAAILVSAVLLAALRRPPIGALTVVFLVGIGTSAVPHQAPVFVLVAVAAGLVTDGLSQLLRPSVDRPRALAWLSVLSPAILVALYFGAIELTVGVAWPLELWSGSILLAGGAGLALALLVVSLVPARGLGHGTDDGTIAVA